MPNFRYRALTKSGEIVSGEISAPSVGEVAQHRGELGQYEQQEKHQNAACREQHEGRVTQGVGQLAAQGFSPRPLLPERLENMRKRTGGLPDPHQRDVDRGKQRRVARHRLAKTLAREYCGPDL